MSKLYRGILYGLTFELTALIAAGVLYNIALECLNTGRA